MKKFKARAMLVLDYKKRNDSKTFQLSTYLIASNSGIEEAFKFMHQSIITKIRNYVSNNWIVLDVVIKNNIKIFEY